MQNLCNLQTNKTAKKFYDDCLPSVNKNNCELIHLLFRWNLDWHTRKWHEYETKVWLVLRHELNHVNWAKKNYDI